MTLVVRNAPTTAIRDVISSRRISVSFICKLRNKKSPPLWCSKDLKTVRPAVCGGGRVPEKIPVSSSKHEKNARNVTGAGGDYTAK